MKKLPDHERKDVRVQVMMTPEEYQQLATDAARENRYVSGHARKLLLSALKKPARSPRPDRMISPSDLMTR